MKGKGSKIVTAYQKYSGLTSKVCSTAEEPGKILLSRNDGEIMILREYIDYSCEWSSSIVAGLHQNVCFPIKTNKVCDESKESALNRRIVGYVKEIRKGNTVLFYLDLTHWDLFKFWILSRNT